MIVNLPQPNAPATLCRDITWQFAKLHRPLPQFVSVGVSKRCGCSRPWLDLSDAQER
jgi:hypothetical protein